MVNLKLRLSSISYSDLRIRSVAMISALWASTIRGIEPYWPDEHASEVVNAITDSPV